MSEIFDGHFEGYENKEIFYVVIGGYDNIWKDVETEYSKRNIYENCFQIPLGVYKNMDEAFGRGFLYLSGMISENDKDEITITRPVKMSDNQGIIFGLKGEKDNIYTWVQILWYYEDKEV